MSNAIRKSPATNTTAWFYCTLLFLLIDYGRPQDLVPAIGLIRPGLLAMLILIVFLIKHWATVSMKSRQIRMIWYFIALLSVYIPFAQNGHYAYKTFIDMLSLMPFILSIAVCVDSIQRLRTFMKFYIGLMVYISLYALTHKGMGSGNYFVDENDVSLFIDMVMPFCYFLFLSEKEKKSKLFYGAALMIGLLAVVVSFSRGGFVGLVAAFFVVWLVSPRKFLTVFLILVLGAVVVLFGDKKYENEMATVTDTQENTAHNRLMSWASGWDMFVDNPLGVGGNNYQVRFPEYQGERFDRGMWGRVAHSLWFTLIPELGVVGIFIYFRLIFFNLKGALSIRTKTQNPTPEDKYLNSLSISFVAGIAGFLAAGTFISVLYYPHYWYLTAVIVATERIRAKAKDTSALGSAAPHA